MRLRQLEYFIEVAEEKNFSKAASNLYVSQPTLSQQIALLEKDLNVKLFDRNSKTVKLTKAGDFLYDQALKIFSQINHIEKSIVNFSSNKAKLNIGVIWNLKYLGYTDSLNKYIDKRNDIEISIIPESSNNVQKGIINKKFDIGITIIDQDNIHKEIKIAKKLSDIDIVAGIPVGHPLVNKKEIDFKDLINYPIISMDKGSILYYDIEKYLIDNKFNIICNCASFDTACEMVRGGMGICIVGLPPKSSKNENNGVVFRKIKRHANKSYVFACIVAIDTNNSYIDELIKELSESI